MEWVAVAFSRGSSQPRNQTGVSCFAAGFFTRWATRESQRLLGVYYVPGKVEGILQVLAYFIFIKNNPVG